MGMKRPDWNPLTDSVPDEIALPNAPLIRVIAQVRYPLIASIERQAFIAPFQEAIRNTYPFASREAGQQIVVSRSNVAISAVNGQDVWRFQDTRRNWRISLAPSFLALETDHYRSRADFLERFSVLVRALHEHIKPSHVERLGMRYIDRVEGVSRDELADLLRPELVGVLNGPLGAQTSLSVSESLFNVPEEGAQLRARWALTPPHTTIDPATIPPSDVESWVLDLDMFSALQTEFHSEEVLERIERFAARIYSCFRWATTDNFLRRFGGEI